MTLKEFAASHNMPLAKVKKLAQEVLEEVPAIFTQDQQDRLNQALALTSQNFLKQSEDFLEGEKEQQEEDRAELIVSETIDIEVQNRIADIVGSPLLKKNALLYISFLNQTFQDNKFKIESAIFQVEQTFYNKLQNYQHSLYEDGRERVKVNSSNLVNLLSARGVKAELQKNDDPELAQLLEKALEFFAEEE